MTTTEGELINYNGIDSGVGGSGDSSGDQKTSPTTKSISEINQNNFNNWAFSTSAASPSSSFSSPSTGMLANVVGYARSRLFKNANDGLLMPGEKDEQISFHHSSFASIPTNSKDLNLQQQTLAFAQPLKNKVFEEEKNKIKNKSCPVQRKQLFSLTNEQLKEQKNKKCFSQPFCKERLSPSIGSRDSVIIENSLSNNNSIYSSKTSFYNGDYCKSINENKKEEEYWQLFAVSLHKVGCF
uniref:Uncharacterized protein n=1 Tax=Meloidogyne enterolobii TaxID=390850 RepID=A0A6V7VXM4_MELEN|nr:unnamed protein product [Meloidogyne enterolobii]